jgi:hypothetical protein
VGCVDDVKRSEEEEGLATVVEEEVIRGGPLRRQLEGVFPARLCAAERER